MCEISTSPEVRNGVDNSTGCFGRDAFSTRSLLKGGLYRPEPVKESGRFFHVSCLSSPLRSTTSNYLQ